MADKDSREKPVTGIDEALSAFKQYLRRHGMRVTPEREEICREVYATAIHFDAEELINRVRASGASASRATIYRTLEVMEECGLVKKLRQTDTRHHYERTFGLEHHDHLFCEGCGEVIEFRDDRIEDLQNEECQKYGFVPKRHTLHIFGLCRTCFLKEMGKPTKAEG